MEAPSPSKNPTVLGAEADEAAERILLGMCERRTMNFFVRK